MGLTIGYVRVSTEDQVEYSPDAQAARCREYARLHDLGPITVLRDEGWSGKNLERPRMTELLALIEAGRAAHVIVWRLDRLSRDTMDLSRLVRLCEHHGVTLHSVNEGGIDVSTAAGRMNVGIHGVFAQFYREHIVENVRMGMEQKARTGHWQNRAPTGYDMVNGYLVANEQAPLVRRVFQLRTQGASYAAIETEVGLCYSTVRQVLHNRVYRGEVRLRDQWFPGIHEPLIDAATWDAVKRAHVPGRRRGRDLLSGRVRCGLCQRVVGVDYNERGQAIYKCRHRGQGCRLPGRSAKGLQRAALLGLRLLATDDELQTAIRVELQAHEPAAPGDVHRSSLVAALGQKRRKLLDLHYADQISAEAFADEERRLTSQLAALQAEEEQVEHERARRSELSAQFEAVARLLHKIDVDTMWQEATPAERRVLIEDLVEAVVIHPDRLQVLVNGAPPLNVTLAEVGLRDPGTKTSVSEGGLAARGNSATHAGCVAIGVNRRSIHPRLPRRASKSEDEKVRLGQSPELSLAARSGLAVPNGDEVQAAESKGLVAPLELALEVLVVVKAQQWTNRALRNLEERCVG
jgi:DNA invertase Pin-like site-specific DNA recombinase